MPRLAASPLLWLSLSCGLFFFLIERSLETFLWGLNQLQSWESPEEWTQADVGEGIVL